MKSEEDFIELGEWQLNAFKQKDKYKQALEEIREITEVNSLNTCWTILYNCNVCHNNNECGEQSPIAKLKFIKDKIDEVLNEK